MDRGAARSRKRAQPQSNQEIPPKRSTTQPSASAAIYSTTSQPGPSRLTKPTPVHKSRSIREPQSRDPALYRAKAVRSSAALIYSEEAFPLPPPKDILKGVRRIDLAGSGVKDIDWLKECEEVTWLNLAGCEDLIGWEGIGHLEKLSVLNISNCRLQEIPRSLSRLSNLKALVAMGNPWTSINAEVIGSWKELNSLIISHSPNLDTLPSTLSQSYYLSKLTFSHCPSIKPESLPDLSTLPLLRDVKMNNLPYLSLLPPHITTWGTGELSLVKSLNEDSSSVIKRGDGLEVLDLGNCSLTDTALSLFIPSNPQISKSKSKTSTSATSAPRWPHLRSLSLHSNPLTTTTPDYSTLLQASTDLPSLQIIDARRVVERKRKGELGVSKAERRANERREKRVKPSGANVGGMGKVRTWGGEDVAKAEAVKIEGEEVVGGEAGARKDKSREGEKKEKKRKRHHEDVPVDQAVTLPVKPNRIATKGKTEDPVPIKASAAQDERSSKRIKSQTTGQASQPVPVDPSTLPAQTKHKPTKSETAVVQVIDVAKDVAGKKGKKDKRGDVGAGGKGLDLRAVFGKKDEAEGTGLGVGGW